jgi:hypothetical protein
MTSPQVTAQLPDFAVGSKDSIKLKARPAAAAAAGAASKLAAASAWLLAGDDLGDGDEELVDDEALLTKEDRQRPAPGAAGAADADDCELGPGGARKACKNCSCGRAEAEAKGEKVTLTPEMLENPQSACGNVRFFLGGGCCGGDVCGGWWVLLWGEEEGRFVLLARGVGSVACGKVPGGSSLSASCSHW